MLVREGRPQKQAVAIALREARDNWRARRPGMPYPRHLKDTRPNAEILIYRVGKAQQGALEIYVFDPAVVDDLEGLDVRMRGNVLQIAPQDAEAFIGALITAANSADVDVERALTAEDRKLARKDRDALERLTRRIINDLVP